MIAPGLRDRGCSAESVRRPEPARRPPPGSLPSAPRLQSPLNPSRHSVPPDSELLLAEGTLRPGRNSRAHHPGRAAPAGAAPRLQDGQLPRMRMALLADIHGNAAALEAVLEHAAEHGADDVVCLGDIVGYGPAPNRCIELVRQHCSVVVSGNHDRAVISPELLAWFNWAARSALEWTAEHIAPANRAYLAALPVQFSRDGTLFCHGSPVDPDDYILSPYEARSQFAAFSEQLGFFGHTHVPAIYELKRTANAQARCRYREPYSRRPPRLDQSRRYLVNPGSVGQPRDSDHRAAYSLYDTATGLIRFYRVTYAVEEVQRAILANGLPPWLAERLELGL